MGQSFVPGDRRGSAAVNMTEMPETRLNRAIENPPRISIMLSSSNLIGPFSGRAGPFWAAKVQELAEELCNRSGLPVELWDERLSSVAAHEILDEAGRDRRDRKYVIDQVAAVVILRGWMEFQEQAAALEQRNSHNQNGAEKER
jgi:hypothetical protein